MSDTFKSLLLGATLLAGLATEAAAAPLVTTPVDDAARVILTGETARLPVRAQDMGPIAGASELTHIQLVLRRPAERQAALDALVRNQQDRASPDYHNWLAADGLRAYGPDQADIDAVVAWLQGHGLHVNEVSPTGMSIDFGGTAQAVAETFRTALHQVRLASGEMHLANASDPAIAAALAPAVRGVVLANFFPRSNMVRATRPVAKSPAGAHGATPDFNVSGYEAMGPQDFNTIYDVNPLLRGQTGAGKLTGAGVTVAVLEQTDIQSLDWRDFRRDFGLSTYAGRLLDQHPHCDDPGTTADEGEAALDAEWVSVADPDATVIEASCASTVLTFGVETALRGVVEHRSDATVLSISYGGPEQQASAAFLAGWTDLLEEAAAEGKSVFISTGDSGTSYDRDAVAVDGLAVNGLSANAYNTAIGGTDFLDSFMGTNAQYWTQANLGHFRSALSYIPETPWDNSCAGNLIMRYGHYQSAIAACNDPGSAYRFQNGVGASGGVSTLYAKPDFQSSGIPGMPADGRRDQPDVSLFAANGFWGHFLVFCMSDPNQGGTACNYHSLADTFSNAAGGTSFAAPAFAGIAALIVQRGGAVGNTAPRLYALAKAQFTAPASANACRSGQPAGKAAGCVFHVVTQGNNAEPCAASTGDCHSTAQAVLGIGVLRGADYPTADAYPATSGYSLATGLGSVNVANLVAAY